MAVGVGDTTIASSRPATGSGRIIPERSVPSTRLSGGTGEVSPSRAATRIGEVPISTAGSGRVGGTFGGEVGDAAGGATLDICGGTAGSVSRGTARGSNGGSASGETWEPIGGGTRCPIGVARRDGPQWDIGGAAAAACGFSTKMRSWHLGHRMHAPFAPFSNASFRRYPVLQELHWTTMPMAQPVPRRKPRPIIGRYSVKGKHTVKSRYIGEGCFRT